MHIITRIFFITSCIFSVSLSQAQSVYSLSNNTRSTGKPTSFRQLGNHIIVEFKGCSNLNNRVGLETVLREAALAANATVLSVTTHQFEPVGVTGVAVLQESHISANSAFSAKKP